MDIATIQGLNRKGWKLIEVIPTGDDPGPTYVLMRGERYIADVYKLELEHNFLMRGADDRVWKIFDNADTRRLANLLKKDFMRILVIDKDCMRAGWYNSGERILILLAYPVLWLDIFEILSLGPQEKWALLAGEANTKWN